MALRVHELADWAVCGGCFENAASVLGSCGHLSCNSCLRPGDPRCIVCHQVGQIRNVSALSEENLTFLRASSAANMLGQVQKQLTHVDRLIKYQGERSKEVVRGLRARLDSYAHDFNRSSEREKSLLEQLAEAKEHIRMLEEQSTVNSSKYERLKGSTQHNTGSASMTGREFVFSPAISVAEQTRAHRPRDIPIGSERHWKLTQDNIGLPFTPRTNEPSRHPPQSEVRGANSLTTHPNSSGNLGTGEPNAPLNSRGATPNSSSRPGAGARLQIRTFPTAPSISRATPGSGKRSLSSFQSASATKPGAIVAGETSSVSSSTGRFHVRPQSSTAENLPLIRRPETPMFAKRRATGDNNISSSVDRFARLRS